ncbi:hypothetical protein MPOCJGCO_4494 [Methylobacterium trifolii]|uniref:Uncharacterized protein n=1 Tax=Methylobacterium trifolii TaxID=1003092 RepID=A0ABQ4U6E0_9HYPH|nr:hypothetical protein MPOCJGCO_4494 [Methylobacterium trifolii]
MAFEAPLVEAISPEPRRDGDAASAVSRRVDTASGTERITVRDEPGCDSTTVALSGEVRATNGLASPDGATATATLSRDWRTMPFASVARRPTSLLPAGRAGGTMANWPFPSATARAVGLPSTKSSTVPFGVARPATTSSPFGSTRTVSNDGELGSGAPGATATPGSPGVRSIAGLSRAIASEVFPLLASTSGRDRAATGRPPSPFEEGSEDPSRQRAPSPPTKARISPIPMRRARSAMAAPRRRIGGAACLAGTGTSVVAPFREPPRLRNRAASNPTTIRRIAGNTLRKARLRRVSIVLSSPMPP